MNFDSPSTFSSFAAATGASALTSTALASTARAAAGAADLACPPDADRGIS